ncbi:uncharacterized protein LOC122247922 [Penaeus japonicus]|uniref:uncharacterized protein LOC122247922 n=1 Tax=Penaeus japonicus TaxID=27405 RepID=UPI001C716652|nr:uncharacterized protein LOC122247922 [Penaeus japonicus]
MLLRTLSAFLKVLTFCGSFPFVRRDSGPPTLTRGGPQFPRRVCFQKSNILTLWSIIVVVLTVGFTICELVLTFSLFVVSQEMSLKASLGCFLAGTTLHTIMYICLVIRCPLLKNIVENLHNLDEPETVDYKPWINANLQSVSEEGPGQNAIQSNEFTCDVKQRSTIFQSVIRDLPILIRSLVLASCTILQAIFSLDSNLKNPTSPVWYMSFIATVLGLLLQTAVVVVFNITLRILARALRESRLRLLGNDSSQPVAAARQTLERFQTFIRKIDQLQILVMKSFGITIFFFVSAGLVSSFPLLFMLTKSGSSINGSSLAFLLQLLFSMWIVFSSPEPLRQEREQTAERMKDVLTVTEDSRAYEKGQWLLQLLQDPPSFSVLGFFILGSHCILEVASCTLTYFIILVQFDAGSVPEAVAGNYTLQE